MFKREDFFDWITPQYLYFAAFIFGVITTCIVIVIYIFLYRKKRRHRTKQKLSGLVNTWISDALMDEQSPEFILPGRYAKAVKKAYVRQFITDSLVNAKKSLSGIGGDSIVKLYIGFGLKRDSIRKMQSYKWYKKAKGIYELYMMDQHDALLDVYDYTNSRNEFVRMEAQTAMIGFRGFDGLVFLDSLDYPLNEWQQVKLLEQLSELDPGDMNHMPLWLKSENEYVVQFALKLADVYQQFHLHDEVVECLSGSNEKIRYQAIKTLGRIANDETPLILKKHYPTETVANKRKILKQLTVIGDSNDASFLVDKLDEEDHSLILEAGRALVSVTQDGLAILNNKAQNSDVLSSIVKQIKFEKGV